MGIKWVDNHINFHAFVFSMDDSPRFQMYTGRNSNIPLLRMANNFQKNSIQLNTSYQHVFLEIVSDFIWYLRHTYDTVTVIVLNAV